MEFKYALNNEKNTPLVRDDENGLILKLIISTFNIQVLSPQKGVRHSVKWGDNSILLYSKSMTENNAILHTIPIEELNKYVMLCFFHNNNINYTFFILP